MFPTDDNVAADAIAEILAALAGYEARNFGGREPGRLFQSRKTWLASRGYSGYLARYGLGLAKPCIPGLTRRHAIALSAARMLPGSATRRLKSAADAIQLKHDGSRLRAFYPSRTVIANCIKVVARDSPLGARTRH